MKHWKIILAICLVALFCGCAGILFGFVVGEKIGELRHQETGAVNQLAHLQADVVTMENCFDRNDIVAMITVPGGTNEHQ